MAKKIEREKVNSGDPFKGTLEKRVKPKPRYFAVRKLRGPGEHSGYLTIQAHDEADAKRQWFNKHGQAQRSHAFDLQAVELGINHPSVKEAIRAPHPSGQGGESVQDMMNQDFAQVQQAIGSGNPEPAPQPAKTAG